MSSSRDNAGTQYINFYGTIDFLGKFFEEIMSNKGFLTEEIVSKIWILNFIFY